MDKSKITITATEEQQKILNKRWDEAGIGNDYIFSCVMRNESTFLQLMQRIFPELKLSQSGTAFSADTLLRAIQNEKRTV